MEGVLVPILSLGESLKISNIHFGLKLSEKVLFCFLSFIKK